MKFAIFDLEIIKGIPDGDPDPGIEYCAGWNDFANMGISVAAFKRSPTIGDSATVDPVHFCDPQPIAHYIQSLRWNGYKIGGFNSRKFDDKLLKANDIGFDSDFDVLEMVLDAAGMTNVKYWEQGRSYNLDAIARANGMAKTGSGSLAAILWQQGQHQEVIDYCVNDVDIEYRILELLLAGDLIDPNTGEKLQASLPC